MNPLRQALKWTMSTFLPRHRWLVHGPRTSRGIALTFDDGPHPEYTPRLLNELQRHGVRATFFVVGQAAEQYPLLVQRMAAEGHAVGTHTYTHSEPSQTSPDKLIQEVHRSLELCRRLLGNQPTLFRPPKGQLTFAKLWKLWSLRQTIVLWDQDPKDYQSDQNGVLKWVDQYQPRGGDIVLLHDNHPHCIAAIEPLVRRATERGLDSSRQIREWVPDQCPTRHERATPGRVSIASLEASRSGPSSGATTDVFRNPRVNDPP